MLQRLGVVSLGVLLGVFGHARVALTQTAPTYACVPHAVGLVRVIGPTEDCRPDGPVTWTRGNAEFAEADGAQARGEKKHLEPSHEKDWPAGPPAAAPTTALTIVTDLPDIRVGTSNLTDTWYLIRALDFVKKSSKSRLRVTYQDTNGAKTFTYGACQWRIAVDGVVVASFSAGDAEGSFGWRMQNAAHMAWAFDVGAGAHQVTVENLRTVNANECLSGWGTTGNFLSVEEIR